MLQNTTQQAYNIAQSARAHLGFTFVIASDIEQAYALQHAIGFFYDEHPIILFPDWETLPYDTFSPHADITSQRLEILAQLPHLQHGILITSISTALHYLPPVDHVGAHSVALKKKQVIDIQHFTRQLEKNGYRHANPVMEHGEFAVRGAIIDLYPMGSDVPYRLELWDNQIDTIRTFDIHTQRSIEQTDRITLLPGHEIPLDKQAIQNFHQQWQSNLPGNPLNCPLYCDTLDGKHAQGIEYYLPLFFEKPATLWDYLPQNTLIMRSKQMATDVETFWQEINLRYDGLRHDVYRPVLPPNALFLSQQDTFARCNPFSQMTFSAQAADFPDLRIERQRKHPLEKLQNFLVEKSDNKILFTVESLGRQETLCDILRIANIEPHKTENWNAFLQSTHRFNITVAPLNEGLSLPPSPKSSGYPDLERRKPTIIITEAQILGLHASIGKRKKTNVPNPENMIRHLAELHVGDAVVHIEHGVGRFVGLQTLSSGGITDEYVTLAYANDDKLYVPIAHLHLIHRYGGTHLDNAPLHALGSSKWEKIKEKAAKRARDVTAELLEIHARRATKKGFAFDTHGRDYQLFVQDFPFEETPDQLTATEHVLHDMQSQKTMDRVICGDVGFGKTEIAMRASFVAALNHKQTAILVPTTLLAQQHYENFKERFAPWPIHIAMLSRFCTTKEQQHTIQNLADGKIDIVIGTHKLLQKNIAFQNLGLLVIDEEHRFGVTQKERIKSLRAEVDILTLTATPIPRTLNMAFAGMRDLSLIASPPKQRLSIKTFWFSFKMCG